MLRGPKQNPAQSKYLVREAVIAHLDLGGVRLEDNVVVTEVRWCASCVSSVGGLCVKAMLVLPHFGGVRLEDVVLVTHVG